MYESSVQKASTKKSQGTIIRDYVHETDFEAVKKIHDSTEIDYQMPDLSSKLWLVTKVLEVDGIVRTALGTYIQVELYLWMDKSDWASPEEKHLAIKLIEEETLNEAWLRGVDQAVLWLPPGMERFGKRLETDFGFTPDRDGWKSYSRPTKI
jgi:hypothetical protein